MTKPLFLALLMIGPACLRAEPLNMKVSGESREKAELETLSPPPDVPNADALSFSLDGGKSAIEGELSPLSVADAAKMSAGRTLPAPGFPLIPSAPFVVQAAPRKLSPDTLWTFRVVDELNRVWHEDSGAGQPPAQLAWDGADKDIFVMDPNRTYYSMFVASTVSKGIATFPGEANRFIAMVHAREKDLWFEFGARLYAPGEVRFSEEGKFYLKDVVRRLHQSVGPWSVTVMEPENTDAPALGADRRQLWKAFLEKELGKTFADERFVLKKPETGESAARLVMINAAAPDVEILMHGPAASNPPAMEKVETLVQMKKVKDVTVVEMRHDRLFRPGSAYLRDESLPQLLKALENLPRDQKVLLRSYTEKVRDDKREEEDPKLTATRSKVLFSLFAEKGFLKL